MSKHSLKKKKKIVRGMPKLGLADTFLYWFAIIGCFCGALFFMFFPDNHLKRLTEANPDVIAFVNTKFGYCMWLVFLLIIFGFVLLIPYFERYPVFGRRDIKYGPPSYPKIYPLMTKNKPKHWQSQYDIKRKRITIAVVSGVLILSTIISAALYPLSLYSRYELRTNGSVIYYDTRNHPTEYTIEDITCICLDTGHSSGKSRIWYASMQFTFSDGERCRFSLDKFGDDTAEAIRTAMTLKELYGSLVVIEGSKDLWKVVRDKELNKAEEELLYELFEAES